MQHSGSQKVLLQPLALPGLASHRSPTTTRGLLSARTEQLSEARQAFQYRQHLHAGMRHKPLGPYQPSASRSRLKSETAPKQQKNVSTFTLGNPKMRPHFVTMANAMIRKVKLPKTSNPGILSEHLRWMKHKF